MEANKPDYFTDGFLLKYFNIYPDGFDKNNLFEEQKYFLMYLMGVIPKLEDWNMQVDYQTQIKNVSLLTIKDVEFSQTDIDVAKLQGRDINEIKRERLRQEKEKRISEIKKQFGIKEEIKLPDLPENIENPATEQDLHKKQLWDILECKGLLNKKHGL